MSITEFLIAVLLMVIPMIIPSLTIFWRCLLWLVAWALGLHLFFSAVSVTARLPIVVKIALLIGLTGFLVAGMYNPVLRLWRAEMAAATSGYLSMPGRQNHSSRIIEIGNSGTRLDFTRNPNQDVMKFLWNAGLRVESSDRGLEIITPIRDRAGHMVAEINKNYWTVNPECWDKNYTWKGDAFEVKDRRGHVVFQIRFLTDRVQIQGEWRDEFGNGVRLFSLGKGKGSLFMMWNTPEKEREREASIEPIFNYPSKEHWGEMVTKQ